MPEDAGKKGFFARINEALYETVETGDTAGAPEPVAPGGRKPAAAAPAAAPADDKPIGSPTDLATRVKADIAGRGPAFTQFLALAASFAEIIPDESGRYRAAMKALEPEGFLIHVYDRYTPLTDIVDMSLKKESATSSASPRERTGSAKVKKERAGEARQ